MGAYRKTVGDPAEPFKKLAIRVAALERRQRSRSRGIVNIAWPGGSATSSAMAVPHGLSGVPVDAQVTSSSPTINVAITAVDDTNLTIQARDVDGTTHAAGNFAQARWRAGL